MIEIIKSGKMFLLIADIDDFHDIREIKEALNAIGQIDLLAFDDLLPTAKEFLLKKRWLRRPQ